MKKLGDSKVTVRVEVTVEGASAGPVKTTVEVTHPVGPDHDHFGVIVKPEPSPSDTPVFVIASQRCIESQGTSQQVQGHFPDKAFAMAFCGAAVDPAKFPTPVSGSASADVDPSLGTWSFTVAKNNAVPGADCCDGNAHGPNNSTLIVWFRFGSTFSQASTPFHAYCPGSGSGAGPGVAKVVIGSQVLPATLHAVFSKALSSLGTVALVWNGVSWVGRSAHSGGAVLSLLCRDSDFQLQATGPATTFIVAGKPKSLRPFHWTIGGVAVGTLAGPFEVAVTE
jgi:hypothetical protein